MSQEKNALQIFLNELRGIEPLTIERQHELGNAIQGGDDSAIDELVVHNIRYIVSLIKEMPEWQYGRVDMEDLISAGYEAMFKCATTWKPMDSIPFIAYARPFMLRAIVRYIDNTSNIIRLPVNISEEVRKMKYHERRLMQELGRQPTVGEIAGKLEIEESRIHQLRGYLIREPKSLDSDFKQDHIETEED